MVPHDQIVPRRQSKPAYPGRTRDLGERRKTDQNASLRLSQKSREINLRFLPNDVEVTFSTFSHDAALRDLCS
jgi:hypothetical protein